jgi:hypothetical protein
VSQVVKEEGFICTGDAQERKAEGESKIFLKAKSAQKKE